MYSLHKRFKMINRVIEFFSRHDYKSIHTACACIWVSIVTFLLIVSSFAIPDFLHQPVSEDNPHLQYWTLQTAVKIYIVGLIAFFISSIVRQWDNWGEIYMKVLFAVAEQILCTVTIITATIVVIGLVNLTVWSFS